MNDYSEPINHLLGLLEKVPGGRQLEAELLEVKKLLLDQRAPRFMLVGRRGSGKSSLVNAIFGQQVAEVGHTKAQTGRGRWWVFEGDLGSIEILDTRGLQEGSYPEGEDDKKNPLESIVASIGTKSPDAVLFIAKAKEIDAAIDGDIESLLAIRHRLNDEQVPIVGVITHVDELEPKNTRLHDSDNEDPVDVEEKLKHVHHVQRLLEDKIRQHPELKKDLVSVIGVSSYMSWRRDGSLRADERWHVEDLVSYLAQELPHEAQVTFARLSRVTKVRRKIARQLTGVVSSLCGGIAVIPIPAADIAPITSLQVSLVAGIAHISGRELTIKTAGEFLAAIGANVGIGYGMRELSRALLKFLAPGAGTAASMALAAGATYAIGLAASAYFIEDKSIDEVKSRFRKERQNSTSQT